jgi:hypothetical protein
MAAGAVTGLSIGFVPKRTEMAMVDGKTVERFLEIELREVSLTPMPSVPGTDVLGARSDKSTPDVPEQPRDSVRTDRDLLMIAARTALDALSVTDRQAVLDAYASPYLDDAAPGTRSDCCAPPTPAPAREDAAVTMADRLAAVRQTYSV